MRNYYFCEADSKVYTEREMKKSDFPSGRFCLIGSFKSRSEAETLVNTDRDTQVKIEKFLYRDLGYMLPDLADGK